MRSRKVVSIMVALIAVSFVGNVWAAKNKESPISSRVEQKFMEDSHFKHSDIKADANKKGEVTLSGTVSSEADKERATEIARSVDGVKKVDNELKVSKTGFFKY